MITFSRVMTTLVAGLLTVGSTVSRTPLPQPGSRRRQPRDGRGFQGASIVVAWNRELLDIVQTPARSRRRSTRPAATPSSTRRSTTR